MIKNSGILKGLTVLDCSQILAGPFCSMILADMGARVIKIEKPNGGDDIRKWGPFKNGESVGFMNLNRNKESIVIDFKNDDGIETMKSLVKKSDVIIENYRTGTMEKLGLGYEDLKKINDKIIYCSISGFGRTGPYAQRAGFDLVAQGMSGLMSITGHPDNPPAKVGVPIADLNTGMYALSAIEAAYINLLKNNEGQYIEVSLLESALAYTVWESTGYFHNEEIAEPLGSAHRVSAPYQALKTKDGYLNVAAPNQRNWERLCEAIGRNDLQENKNFIDNTNRMKNLKDLETELEKTFMKKNRNQWIEILDNAGVPCGPINNINEVWEDPQIKYRNMRIKTEHPKIGEVDNIGVVAKFLEKPSSIRTPSPLLGEHTKNVLIDFGFSEEKIKNLFDNEAIF
ncbi:MAG: CoA transferase [Dehalococcoidia bacterium]|nr:CoA transferase [Dehalococcoidia bacterium]|tara:strand:- start:828 stop:2024 length:1197 start_codon:yes stop_codon:yes gene_type:complete